MADSVTSFKQLAGDPLALGLVVNPVRGETGKKKKKIDDDDDDDDDKEDNEDTEYNNDNNDDEYK